MQADGDGATPPMTSHCLPGAGFEGEARAAAPLCGLHRCRLAGWTRGRWGSSHTAAAICHPMPLMSASPTSRSASGHPPRSPPALPEVYPEEVYSFKKVENPCLRYIVSRPTGLGPSSFVGEGTPSSMNLGLEGGKVYMPRTRIVGTKRTCEIGVS